MKRIGFILGIIAISIFNSCGTDDVENIVQDDNVTKTDFTITGFAQKGQFIKGSSITAYSHNNELAATGASFPAVIFDDLGSFNLSADVSAPYMELKAEGYYFNENTGTTSSAPLYLSALVKSNQESANINLLTTITSGRIRKLIKSGQSFDSAKKQAEKEALDVLSINSSDVPAGFENMNISNDNYADGILLAVSCMIQEGRNAGEIQKLISDISTEFESSGTISQSTLNKLEQSRANISVPNVIDNMRSFYNELNITDYKLPPFYAIIDRRFSEGFHIVSNQLSFNYDFSPEGGVMEMTAISYEDFTIEADAEWVKTEATEKSSNLYTLSINVPNNPVYSERSATITVKSKNGEALFTRTIIQEGSGQCIVIKTKYNRSRNIREGDVVNVNSVNYSIKFNSRFGEYCVYVPYSDSGYGISNKPETVIAGTNGDVLCATFTYGRDINEVAVVNSPEELVQSNGRTGVTLSTTTDSSLPCYAALKSFGDITIPNPSQVTLDPVCSLLSLNFVNDNGNPVSNIAKIEVETDADGFLSGEVTSCMYPTQSLYDPTYTVPQDSYRNKSNRVTVHNTDNDNFVSFLIHPQTLGMIKCTAYDESNNQLFQIQQNLNLDLLHQKGNKIILNFRLSE